MHKVQDNQKVRIISVEIAVAADTDPDFVADELSALLSENGTASKESTILDWRYTGKERMTQAGAAPEEGEIFQPPQAIPPMPVPKPQAVTEVSRSDIAEFGVTTNALLEKHFGIELIDTCLHEPRFIAQYIQAGQRPFEAINEVAEDCGFERIDKQEPYGLPSTAPLTSDDEEAVKTVVGGEQMVPEGVVESAMHMIDGLVAENNMGEVLEVWGQGCAELYQSLIPYAEKCHKIFDEGYTANEDCPGVFDYEVSCLFGAWYGQQIIEDGSAPTRDEALAQLDELTNQFWQQLDDCCVAPG